MVAGEVTIVTPTLNRPLDILKRCIRSVDGQTYNSWQHLVCSDGKVEPAVQSICGGARRRYCYLTENAGHFGAGVRGRLLEYIESEFVCFLDDDSFFFPRYLEAMVEAMACVPEAQFAICNLLHFGPLPAHHGATPVVLSGNPIDVGFIDTAQVLVRTEAMRQCGWLLEEYVSDGKTYNKLSQMFPHVQVSEVLAAHL